MPDSSDRLKKEGVWPFAIAGIMMLLNADLILIGSVYQEFLSPEEAFRLSCIVGVTEVPIWYWFINWFFTKYVARKIDINEVVEVGRQAVSDLDNRGYRNWLIRYWQRKFDGILTSKSILNRFLIWAIKTLGLWGLFVVSSEPLPFGRTSAIVFCVAMRWKFGILPIMLGNIIHLYWIYLGLRYFYD